MMRHPAPTPDRSTRRLAGPSTQQTCEIVCSSRAIGDFLGIATSLVSTRFDHPVALNDCYGPYCILARLCGSWKNSLCRLPMSPLPMVSHAEDFHNPETPNGWLFESLRP
ncbi:uncharacterized protein BDZ83DRAFT_38944 [Colletotrichum acutatum]|uniref:Uncharacterized protein n=1 Tax=Glomerella acutata TaxID=27357 RepID=A0AAD8XDI0_GLOAC|nr:uncharacterized protein BDZ83DRAFT_38944 [Colletotrichum acutatum]KAK1716813.1 hypothetical protein BDZ83DRAFT_38944 [Colletotrichum acutatum]